MLYALTYGSLPFQYKKGNLDSEREMLKAIKNVKINLKDSASELCINLIKRILEPDPAKRLTVGQILNHPFMTSFEDTNL